MEMWIDLLHLWTENSQGSQPGSTGLRVFINIANAGLCEITWHLDMSREEVLSICTHLLPSQIFERLRIEVETAKETEKEQPEMEKKNQ